MKLYNRELEIIENKERENRIQEIAEKNIAFLVDKYGIDENILRQRLEKMSVVERGGGTHFVIKNGERYEIKSDAPASFVTKKDMEFDGEKWNFENAVYTNDNNGDHTITHELFHILSGNTEMDFNEEDIGYDKVFNHQLWFAASGFLINQQKENKEIFKEIDDFMKNVDSLFDIYNDGLFKHYVTGEEIKHKSWKQFIKKCISFLSF